MIAAKIIAGKGRGVVAMVDIPEGAMIEVASTALIPAEQIPVIHDTALFKYYFVRPGDYQPVETSSFDSAKPVPGYIVFGLVSLCNHSPEPNAHIKWSEDAVGVWSSLIAKRNIAKHEEVTLFYTNIEEYTDKLNFV